MRIAFITLFLATGISSFSQDAWIQRDSIKGPTRANAASFVIDNDDGYIVSGYDGFGKKRSAVSYDVDQDDWDSETSLGGVTGDGLNRTSAIGFNANNYGFVGLGEGEGFVFQDLWKYDKQTDAWTQVADFIGPARTQAVSFAIDGFGYVGTGKGADLSTLYNDFYKYDEALNTWTQVADFPGTGRMDAVGTTCGAQGYVGFGYDGTSYTSDFYQYFPLTDTWNQIASFPGTARINAVAFGVFPQLFIATGDDGFNYLNDTWEYNVFGNVWSQKADFIGDPRSGASAFVIENRPFVGGGFGSGVYYDDFYEYTFTLSTVELSIVDVDIFPNPTSDYLTVRLSENLKHPSFRLFSSDGKEVIIESNLQNSYQDITLNLSDIKSGIYYLAIYEDGQLVQNKSVSVLSH